MADGTTVKVLSELELDGVEDICTQVLKLLEDNWIVPVQLLLDVLMVTEVVSIASENVTEMFLFLITPDWLSVGEIEETAGPVVSTTNELIFNVTLLLKLSVTVMVQFE